MSEERRVFERENVKIPFIYSLDDGESFAEGEWKEAVTVDIGPVLVGGLAFYSDEQFEMNQKIRIALFMDLELKKVWENEPDGFPAIYHGKICRISEENGQKKIAVIFKDTDAATAEEETAGSLPEDLPTEE